MKLCDTCIYRNEDEYHKPCIVYRDDCEYYKKERGDMTGDLINRQAVLDAMSETWKHICYVARRRKPTKGEEAVYSDMVGTIKQLPPVNPQEPKTGHWIKLKVGYGCSECTLATNEYGKGMYRYCPNCGAKMESEVSE